MTRALIDSVGRMPRRLKSSKNRQTPTRMPYSCQLQFGTSGSNVTPVGGGMTCRAIGRAISQTSKLTMLQTMMRPLLGSRSGGRSTIAEYGARWFGGFDPAGTIGVVMWDSPSKDRLYTGTVLPGPNLRG